MGYLLDEQTINAIVRRLRMIPVVSRTMQHDRPQHDRGGYVAEIINVDESDTFVAQLLNAEFDKFGPELVVAKDPMMRHDVENRWAWPTSHTSINSNRIQVSDGSDTYVWKVTPPYTVGDRVTIHNIGLTDLKNSDDQPILWAELKPSREWLAEGASS